MNASERSMGLGLRALNRLAGSELLDRVGQRERVQKLVYQGTRQGFRAASAASSACASPTRSP